MKAFDKLKPLIMMQLKDKLDFSFMQSKRSLIIKSVLEVVKFLAVTAIFYLLFFLCNVLTLFRPAGIIPDTAVNVVFVIIQILSLFTCTAGLMNALYMTADNKVLLTMPATPTTIYISKLAVYFVFELKKNLSFTLPVFLAYGIVNGAVWYYFIWIIVCFIPISLLPVAIGAILSIPALYISDFVKRRKILQFTLIILIAGAIALGLVNLINLIPENIDIQGTWPTIYLGIQSFLNGFANVFKPYYYLTKMMVGGTLRIYTHLFGLDTLLIFVSFLACLTALLVISFAVAKPLFVKMASKQFEFEKAIVPPKKNKTHKKRIAPYVESINMSFRSTRFIIGTFTELVLPAIAILFLNKVYAAMNTNYTGQLMTTAFNFLVMLVLSVSFNNEYATVYSKEANARNLIKTRPIAPVHVLTGRLFVRICTIFLSVIALTVAFLSVSDTSRVQIIFMGVITALVSFAHLLWCAELDVMHSYADQYAMVGMQFDSPNERTATIIGFLLAAFNAFVYYFISMDRGTLHSLTFLLVIAVAFTVFRVYAFVTRSKLYFVEN